MSIKKTNVMKKVLTADFIGAELHFKGEMTYGDFEEGFGAITLSNGGRSYILDVVQSYCTNEIDKTIFELEAEKDEEIFPECKYDLSDEDLYNENLVATIYISDFNKELILAQAFFVVNGEVKTINLTLE